MTSTLLETLAAWVHACPLDSIPEEQLRLSRLRLLDSVGLIAAASDQPVAASLTQWAREYGHGPATLLPEGRGVPAETAAFMHGCLAHARDFDDTFLDSVVHPGSVVVPAALAAAELAGADAFETLASITIGYELAARLGSLAQRRFHARGFHASGIVGPVAAAAVAARLVRLDCERTADALGLATSMSGGLLAFLADGAWSKWLHAGWAARSGLSAVSLARHDFRGPRHALTHPYGLFGAFAGMGEIDTAELTRGLGEDWKGAEARFKLYPCAHVIQPYIDAVLSIRSERGFEVGAVESMRCRIAPWAMPIVAEPRERKTAPKSDLEAISSLPFLLAAALCDGRVDLATLDSETLEREDLRRLAGDVFVVADANLGRGFDGWLDLVLRSGECRRVEVSVGQTDVAMVTEKFRRNVARWYGEQRAASAQSAILGWSSNIRALMHELVREHAVADHP